MLDTPLAATPAPTVSVIIATYERGEKIAATLESVARQSRQPLEILVVSDGPAAAGLADAVARIEGARLIVVETRSRSQSGPNAEGWRQARGEWLAYLGHDDIWHPEHLAAVAATAFAHPDADFVVSGCLYWGPEETGATQTWVTGLFDNDNARAPFEEFFPPSSVTHRRKLPSSAAWGNASLLPLPVDAAFMLDAANDGCRFVSTERVTVSKFASALRYLSYALPQDWEQRRMLDLSSDPVALQDAVDAQLTLARAQGRFMNVKQVPREMFAPGEILARNEITRGIDVGERVRVTDSAWVPIGDGNWGPDWYPPESDVLDTWRWSGPSDSPKLLISALEPGEMRISIEVRAFASVGTKDIVRVRVDGSETRIEWEDGRAGTALRFSVLVSADHPTVVQLSVPVVALPDGRLAGIAITGFELETATSLRSRPSGLSRAMAVRLLERRDREPPSQSDELDEARRDRDAALTALGELRTSRSWRAMNWYRAIGDRLHPPPQN